MNSTGKPEHESKRLPRLLQTVTADIVAAAHDPAGVAQALAACTQAHDELQHAHEDLKMRLAPFAEEFADLQAALQHEQAERQQWELEACRLGDRIARAEAEAGQLGARLREKELLLREIHHRVNNNLQVIISLFHLQLDRLTESKTRALFLESQNRVYAMALIHEKLYRANDFAAIDFGEYVRGLTAQVFRSYGVATDRIGLTVDAENIGFGVETMIPCGLILNELVSNALKYAFPDGRAGCLEVRLRPLDESRYQLVVHDDGVGIPPGMDVRNTDSLGLQIVTALCEQLEGTLAVTGAPGTTVTIAFQEQKSKPRSTRP